MTLMLLDGIVKRLLRLFARLLLLRPSIMAVVLLLRRAWRPMVVIIVCIHGREIIVASRPQGL